MAAVLKNPLLPGFYPDPSVCRKGEDYYLITSTFEYYPGIPVFHSRDFVSWRQIGHVLDRQSQLDLDGLHASRGIYASSIFYHQERRRFYVVSTVVGNAPYDDNVNFLVWSEQPEGPWSDPVVIKGAEGIDPSLFFDGDDAYYLGNLRPVPDQPQKGRHIWLQKLDLDSGKLSGERHTLLTHGAFVDAAAPEGPHLYQIGGWYYLLIAEGGTFRNHAATIFRSSCLTGPYEPNPRNPLITHRNLRSSYPIKNPGHADMIQLHNGEWWAVLLATRPMGGDYGNLGRETYAVPILWEDGWPLFSPDTGHVEASYPAPALLPCGWKPEPERESFDEGQLPLAFITVRTPRHRIYSLTERPGFLRMYLHQNTIRDLTACSFLGRRQQHMCWQLGTEMEFVPEREGESGGIVLLMNGNHHLRMEYMISGGETQICLTRCFQGEERLIGAVGWAAGRTFFKVTAAYQDLDFYVSEDGEIWTLLAGHVDGTLLCRETAGGYTGTVLGLYVTSSGMESSHYADFSWFEYRGL